MTEVLVANDVSCWVDSRPVVDGASFRLHAGESVALLGPSGSGKTVLLSALGGLTPPYSGTVLFMGEPHDVESGHRAGIASIFQTYGLLPLLTAEENIEIALRAAGREPNEARDLARTTLEHMDLGAFARHLSQELSGGQEQRVAVARALAVRPEVILADEPTTEQDERHRDLVLERLLEAVSNGAGVLLATHDYEVAERCQRVVEIEDGRLFEREHGRSR